MKIFPTKNKHLNIEKFVKIKGWRNGWISPKNVLPRCAVRLAGSLAENIKVENLTFFMTLWNILGWSVSILVGLFYLENLSRKQNHMGTEFLWLGDKCLTSESWQEMMAINCFNVTSIQLHQNLDKDFGLVCRMLCAEKYVIFCVVIFVNNRVTNMFKNFRKR